MFSLLFACAFSAKRYSIVVDCGSSGSRAYIYSYDNSERWPNVTFITHKDTWIKLADGAKNESAIVELVSIMDDFSKTIIESELINTTKLLIYATAGMRLLSKEDQKKIIQLTVKEVKKQTSLIISEDDIRVISGNEEGTFLWLTINHLNGRFDNGQTDGGMEIGGASSQIAMEIDTNSLIRNKDYKTLVFKNHIFNIFSHSYLGLGINELGKSIKEFLISKTPDKNVYSPCFYTGYNETYKDRTIFGTSDYEKCTELVRHVFTPIIQEVTLPKYKKGTEYFYGLGCFDSFPMITKLPNVLTLPEIKKGAQELCNMTYEEVPKNKYSSTNCLLGAYAYLTLKEGYKFDDTYKFNFAKKINGVKVSWTMGALIDELYDLYITSQGKGKPIVLYILIGVSSLLVVVAFVTFITLMIKKKARYSFGKI